MNIAELSMPTATHCGTLNPDLWDEHDQLIPSVRDYLMSLAQEFSADMGVSDIDDVRLSGSNASYYHSPQAAIVLSVRAPEIHDEVYQELLNDRIQSWGLENPPHCGSYPVVLDIENSGAEGDCNCGSYSLSENRWVVRPSGRAFTAESAPVGSVVRAWRGRITEADFYSWIHQWRLLESAQAGSVEQWVVAELQGEVAARNRQALVEMSAAPQEPIHYGYGDLKEDAEPTPDGVNPTTCMFLNEKEVTPRADVIREFARLCFDELGITQPPKITLRRDPAWSARNCTFGRYNPSDNTMELSLADRNIMDICRTLAHELVHCRQNERGELGPDSGRDGSPQENEANSLAGEIMRRWGKQHPEFFAAENIGESASGYIPTKREAKDPRYIMALTQDVQPGAVGKEANKLGLVTDKQGRPQIADPSGKIERQLAESLRLFKEGASEIPDWLIDLYDRAVRADHAAGRGASPADKKRATFASKALVKGVNKFWGKDGYRHGYELAMAHKARHGYDDLDDYLDNSLMEKAPESYNWKARVHIKQKGYNGYIDTQIAAPDMRRARTLIAAMYGVSDSDIGSTTRVK